jgi:hypothetical protein
MSKTKKPSKPRIENEKKLQIFLAKLQKDGKTNG